MTGMDYDRARRNDRRNKHPKAIGAPRVDAGEAWEMGLETGRMQGLETGRMQGDAEGYARGMEEGIGIGVEAGFAAGLDVVTEVLADLRSGGAKELIKDVGRRAVAAQMGAAGDVPGKRARAPRRTGPSPRADIKAS